MDFISPGLSFETWLCAWEWYSVLGSLLLTCLSSFLHLETVSKVIQPTQWTMNVSILSLSQSSRSLNDNMHLTFRAVRWSCVCGYIFYVWWGYSPILLVCWAQIGYITLKKFPVAIYVVPQCTNTYPGIGLCHGVLSDRRVRRNWDNPFWNMTKHKPEKP